MKTRQSVTWMAVEKLRKHPGNVREDVGDVEELARSIAEHGILQPLVLTEDPDVDDAYRILAGHRRLAAACRAGMTSVPVVVRHGLGADDTEQVVVMLVENCQRKDLSSMEKAQAFGSLRNRGLTQSDIARRTGMHVSTINYFLALLDLDEDTQADVADGTVKVGDAIAAVRQARQDDRARNGTPARGRPAIVEPSHFGKRHPLADRVRLLCDHSQRWKVAGIGCGQCWEAVIRADALGELEHEEHPPPCSTRRLSCVGLTETTTCRPARPTARRSCAASTPRAATTSRSNGVPDSVTARSCAPARPSASSRTTTQRRRSTAPGSPRARSDRRHRDPQATR